jgi:outer membrane protein assembly factor BamB
MTIRAATRLIGLAVAATLVVGCGSAGPAAVGIGTAPARTGTAPAGAAPAGAAPADAAPARAAQPHSSAPARAENVSCPAPPPRHAWAVAVSDAGRVLWRTPLSTRDEAVDSPIPPLVVGQVAVLAQDGAVYGLRLGDGHRLWSWPGGQDVYGLWPWPGLVVVLTDQVSEHATLTGLDAATGAVRWQLRLPGSGLLGNLAPTADGGLAMMRAGGTLQVVSLATGRVRWTRRTAPSSALTAAGGLVQLAAGGRVTGYADMTGQPRWTVTGVPQQPQSQLADGLVLVTSAVMGGAAPTAMTAIRPATGQVAWRFDPHAAVSLLAAGQPGLAVATYNPYRLYLLNQATGRPRWQADTVAGLFGAPLITSAMVVVAEGRLDARITARDAATGTIRWTVPAGSSAIVAPIVTVGQFALVQGEGEPGQPAPLRAYRLSDGALAWQASMPTFVQDEAVPVLADHEFLIQAADLSYACAAVGSAGTADNPGT